LLWIVGRFDYAWTVWLSNHSWEAVAHFMDQTMFEGESFGGGDPATLCIIVGVIGYALAWAPPLSARLAAWRPYLGFVIGVALIYEVYFVHTLKYVMGRARPGQVLSQACEYTEWFEFGPLYVTQGTYRGSLPSGHTALAFILMTLAFVLVADRRHRPWVRISGVVWGILVTAFCVLMAVSRCMTLSHWIADCVFSLVTGFILMYVLFFWVLRVPLQMQRLREVGCHPSTPDHWELKLAGLLFPVAVGFLCAGLGLRAFWEQEVPWLAGLVVIGGALILGFGRLAMRYQRKIIACYASGSCSAEARS
jgi:membrane-associated phospholipid phosphatase